MLNQKSTAETLSSIDARPEPLTDMYIPWGGSGCSCCCCKCKDIDPRPVFEPDYHNADATLTSVDVPEDVGFDAGFDVVDFMA